MESFLLGTFEVTEAQYLEYCAQTQRKAPEGWPHDEGKYPALVTWEAATSFCAYYGLRLPTEAEFEWALRGGQDAKVYPWGDSECPPERWGNLGDWSYLVTNPALREFAFSAYDDGFSEWAPVGSFSPNALGLYDISGNAWEWCSDWYEVLGSSDATVLAPKGPDAEVLVEDEMWVDNRAIPLPGGKVVRGGGWGPGRDTAKCWFRRGEYPKSAGEFGFRCAKSLEPWHTVDPR